MLATSAQMVFILFMSALLLIITFKLLSGQINTRGLLEDKETGTFSPGRLQLLIVTLGGATFYFFEIVDVADTETLPPVPAELLLIIGGSNVGYLGGKIYSKFFKKPDRA